MEPREAVGSSLTPDRTESRVRSWERWAGIAGLVFVVLDLANRFAPGTPDPTLPTAEFDAQLAADLTGHQVSLWLGFLADAGFLLFLVGLWGRVRRAEGPCGLFGTRFLVAGVVNVAVLLVGRGSYLAVVQYGSTSQPDAAALTALAVLGGWVVAASILPGLVGNVAIAAAILTTGALPRWLGWLATVAAFFALLSLAWFLQTSTDGILGVADAIGSWVSIAFFVAASVLLILRPGNRPDQRPRLA